jgi:hypothetical protein
MTHWLFEETAMTSNTGDSRGRRRAGALAVVSAVAVLTAGCGAAHAGSSGSTASTGSATYRADLAYAQCMRTHGVPNFPDPTEVGGSLDFSVNLQAPQYRAPLKACRRLIPKWVRLP